MKAPIPVLKSVAGLRRFLQMQPRSSPTEGLLGHLGLVPTMGALHQGHLSLMQRARQENAVVIVSIFVNPLQFGPTEDFTQYPRPIERDLAFCQDCGVDAVFVPNAADLVPSSPMTQVVPPIALTQGLCGRSRPGHFQGVATIVLKLLNLVQPDRAYFGRKDAQQLAIIQRLASDLNVATAIVPCPIVREPSGLAYSSRNQYLSAEQTQQALVLSQSLRQAEALFKTGVTDRNSILNMIQTTVGQKSGIEMEYVELVDPQTLEPLERVDPVGMVAIAARVGNTRLIDNIVLDGRKPILAIDGPAGAGKSTVTRLCAQQLGLIHLDTGAMYRAMTWLALQSGVPLEDEVAIADLVSQAELELKLNDSLEVRVNGQDVTQSIRSLEVTAHVSTIAAQPSVRDILRQQQQSYAKVGGVAAEGRDMGTHIFPEAGLKIFLTASVEERARRRHEELQANGNTDITYEQLVRDIAERDRKDSQRKTAPLRKASDAVEILTDGLSVAEVTDKIVHLYKERCPDHALGV
ncbi:bifunctional pantoate--beta-alanine ligase/(d)CMP kinase [Altericista sp. CCNU0014]|uniref:bifunctional pantoate--beta-alanine ligase/(d)CMP kinase n=1 Tax=Altericista sp. CCNU0014 TaxID=3082949 RepID=UPI00384B7BB5